MCINNFARTKYNKPEKLCDRGVPKVHFNTDPYWAINTIMLANKLMIKK